MILDLGVQIRVLAVQIGQEVYYVALGVAAIGSLLFAALKLRPENTRIFVDSAKVSLEISDSARDNLREDLLSLRAELVEARAESARDRAEASQYRNDTESRITELATELRGERAEKRAIAEENDRLKERVRTLEDEVRELKAKQTAALEQVRRPKAT